MATPPNWANRDLRSRSFRRQDLNGADFSGCDLRGCDFSHAQLQHANFERVRVGQTRRQRRLALAIALIVAPLSFCAYSRMVFGALGQTPAEPAWSYVVALIVSLAIAGASPLAVHKPGASVRLVRLLPGTAAAALLCFFYGGTASDQDPQVAVAAAIAGALLAGVGLWRRDLRGYGAVAVHTTGAVAAYGFAWFVGIWAIACLTTGRYGWGVAGSLLALLYLGLTVSGLQQAWRGVRRAGGTSFRGADLTGARFSQQGWETGQFADFTGAIGSVPPL